MAQPNKERERTGGKAAPARVQKPIGKAIGNKLAMRCALLGGLLGLLGGGTTTLVAVGAVAPAVKPENRDEAAGQGRILGLSLTLMWSVAGAVAGFAFGSRLSGRVRELGQTVQKLGRGSVEVRVRATGSDEVTGVARSLQYLANDLAALMKDLEQQERQGGALATMDPLVRQLRDRVLAQNLPQLDGFELDAALSPGSRGGLDYFDAVAVEDTVVCYLVAGEGNGTLSVVAARMARDELQRALAQGHAPRKTLSHANKVLKQTLPPGACAKATLLQLSPVGAKLYQAGARSPLWICQRGEVLELAAEGLALGLDDGPVFDKALRSQEVALSPGTRLVLVNEAGLRTAQLLDLVRQHTPRHTAMFMNVVLGTLEKDAGEGGLREDVVLITAKRAGQT
jgi:HAMP domain-containing protein